MPKVIFLNRYFFPDHSATSQILSDLAFALAADGREIHVIASRQSYDQPGLGLPAEETEGGVAIHRVSTTNFGRSRLLGRSIDYISFYLAVRRKLAALAGAGDIVVAKTDPPLLSLAVLPVVRRRRARLINWLQDIYPEVAMASGIRWLRGPLGAALSASRDRSLKAACANVVVGKRMAEHLAARQIPPQTIRLIPNFADAHEIVPVAVADNPLRKAWGLADKFVVGYSGNLGRVHEYRTVLDAAEQLKNEPRFMFLCIGGGQQFEPFARAARERGLDRKFVFRPYQDRAALKYSLSAADVHWISLRPEFEGLVVPSKLYGAAAAGRPIIAIAADDGELAGLVGDNRCGFTVAPGDARALAQRLTELMNDPQLCAAMGNRARAMFENSFTKERAVGLWRRLLDEAEAAC